MPFTSVPSTPVPFRSALSAARHSPSAASSNGPAAALTTGAPEAITLMCSVTESLAPVASDAVTVTVALPGTRGLPDSRPDLLSDSPGGRPAAV